MGLNILASPLFYAHRHLIMDRATAAHLPTIYEFPEVAEEGGFAAYGPRADELVPNLLPDRASNSSAAARLPISQSNRQAGSSW